MQRLVRSARVRSGQGSSNRGSSNQQGNTQCYSICEPPNQSEDKFASLGETTYLVLGAATFCSLWCDIIMCVAGTLPGTVPYCVVCARHAVCFVGVALVLCSKPVTRNKASECGCSWWPALQLQNFPAYCTASLGTKFKCETPCKHCLCFA